jgi:putative ABC transport system permease protein
VVSGFWFLIYSRDSLTRNQKPQTRNPFLGGMMDTLLQDIRYSIRRLFKNMGFTVVAVLALALGIGANTAIFSVVNSILLQPLAYKDPQQLVTITHSYANLSGASVSPPGFADYRDQSQSFESVAALLDFDYNLTEQGEPEQLRGHRVSSSFFTALGIDPMLGHTFVAEQDQPGHNRVVALSHKLWQRRFNSDPDILGKPIKLNGQSYEVVAVMSASFEWGKDELWSPLALSPANFTANNRGNEFLDVIARLKPGVTREQAQAEMDTIANSIRLANSGTYPEEANWRVRVKSLTDEVVGDIRPVLIVLLIAVGFVLLIACANVANLLLARATARQKEIAIRQALGANRARLIRQLLTESLLLALMSGAAGLLLALWSVDLIVRLNESNIPRAAEVGIDGRVLVFTLLVSLVTAILFGLIPALQTSKIDLQGALKEGGRGSTAGNPHVRRALVVVEIALALVLLIGAGLMIKSFIRLQNVNPGFDPENVLTAEISLPAFKYRERAQISSFFQQVIEQIKNSPGVESAGGISSLPLTGSGWSGSFNIEGRPVAPGQAEPHTALRAITPDYFKAMKIPLIDGRYFDERDRADSGRVVIIDQTLAEHYFPDENPLGKRVEFGMAGPNGPTWREVVGVVGRVRHKSLDAELKDHLYFPHTQSPESGMVLVVRTSIDPVSVTSAVRGAVASVDKDQPVYRVTTMEQVRSDSVSRKRLSMLLLAIFAAVALILAAVGIYGVMSYTVTERTHEIGIRMALGAKAGDVLKLVVGQGMALALAGVVIGVIAALVLTRFMESLLFGVAATDSTTFMLISVLLAGVALLACYIPARRATRVDPMIALRYE